MKVIAAYKAAPTETKTRIVYIPEGEHAITPSVDGKAGAVVSRVPAEKGAAIAAALDSALQQRHAKNVRPTFDFDHKDSGPASAIPTAFSYERGRGVMVDVEWTGAGRQAIEAKDYSYFSPVYLMDRNTGEPVGLPDTGPLGALVNEPAFREIERIAAKHAAIDPQPSPDMSVEALIKAGLLTEAESKTSDVSALADTRLTEIKAKADKADALETELAEVKASIQTANAQAADAILDTAVKAGRIAAKDEATKGFWREQLTNSAGNAEKFSQVKAALNSISPKADGLTKQEVTIEAGAASKPASKEARIEAAQAKARGELGASASFQSVWDRAQSIDPTAFIES